MDSSSPPPQSFIIKVWIELDGDERRRVGRSHWRGFVTHVPSGDRRHVKSLGDIIAFIMPMLERVGVKFPIGWRMVRWWNQRGRLSHEPLAKAEHE